MRQNIILLCLLSLLGTSAGQGCLSGLGWVASGGTCYKFAFHPLSTYKQAVTYCADNGATLLSVSTEAEHKFVKNWLQKYDTERHSWWTSGRMDERKTFWEGDGSKAIYTNGWVETPSDYLDSFFNIIYKYKDAQFGWSLAERDSSMCFICEINIKEVYRIAQERRGFDYGLIVEDVSAVQRGPYFLSEPEPLMVLTKSPLAYFDCIAGGNPTVSYQWYKKNLYGDMEPINTGGKFDIVTGRLNIQNPDSSYDTGTYQCEVKNKYGTILSAPVKLQFGSIGDFPPVTSEGVNAKEYKGAQIECPKIEAKPGLKYQWIKTTSNLLVFLRPERQKHYFISSSGKLMFSEVAASDEGRYRCIAQLPVPSSHQNYLGSSAVQSRTSNEIELRVMSSESSTNNVEIQSEFIKVNPATPIVGMTIQLECFAYGSLPLKYSWRRKSRPLPVGRHLYSSAGRILWLKDIDLSDQDTYTCGVSSTKSNSHQETSLDLEITAKPFFVYPLRDQHVDIGVRLSWHCEAIGKPFPTYTWYKNGKVLTSSDGVTVSGNTLTIVSLDPERDNGMYQCGAVNNQGQTMSTAQMRVLAIKPTFESNPMPKLTIGTRTGDVTLECNPMAAPMPVYTWFKNGSPLDLEAGRYNEEDHYRLLANGDLRIVKISDSDVAKYTCKVENELGVAQGETEFRVGENAKFYRQPIDDQVEVNLTVTLVCQASHNMDMVYEWSFNDHIIDFETEPEYKLGEGLEEGYLYVTDAQFRNEGFYTCAIVSSTDRQEKTCFLRVEGPPGEPGGVNVYSKPPDGVSPNEQDGIIIETTRWLTWVDGHKHWGTISHYFIQFLTEFDKTWRVHPDGINIPASRTIIESRPQQRYVRVTNLKAGASIQFRVIARNEFGIGDPSEPTKMTQINSAAPTAVVTNIRGGGGSIGDLTIWWDPLAREDHNGPNLNYTIQWRLHTLESNKQKFSTKVISHNNACRTRPNIKEGKLMVCQFVTLVTSEMYYTKYDVQIQAYNKLGYGPFSDIAVVLSAELLPQKTPFNVYGIAYNSTALLITWSPIDNARESSGGALKGYKINYWRSGELESTALQNIIELKEGEDNLDRGMIIGLLPRTWYKFNVQAYNSAGNGFKSSDYVQQTWNHVPEKFPTEVYVYSIEGKGVSVKFRGISTQAIEEPLMGYKVQIWKSTENIRSAREYDFGKKNRGIIKNLNSSEIYQLRVFAYSRAGQGKRSSPTVYFTVGEGQILANPETTEIMNEAAAVLPSVLFILLSFILCAWGRRVMDTISFV